MTYSAIRVTDMVYDVAARSLGAMRPCRGCKRPLKIPQYTDLVVQAKERITQDAATVFCLPCLVVSPAFVTVLNEHAHGHFTLADVRLPNHRRFRYQQVRFIPRLSVSVLCHQPGSGCSACGQASLSLKPLILKPLGRSSPPVAHLRESPAIFLLRTDVADACRASSLDIELEPVYLEGEAIPEPGPTFSEGSSWSDL